MAASRKNPESTTLDKDTTKPSTTAPGDGPADTTDPSETAHSVTPQPGPEALKEGTVNAVVPGERIEEAAEIDEKDQRVEKYKATRPDGTEVIVTHNIDTGATSIS